MAIELPVFPEGTRYFLVDGEYPVSLTPTGYCMAWDVPGGRTFPVTSLAYGRGPGISEADFRKIVANPALVA